MKIINIEPQVFERIPNLILFVGKAKIQNPNKKQIDNYLCTSWDKLSTEIKLAQPNKHQKLQLIMSSIKKAGITTSKYPPSIKSIFKRVEKKIEPFKVNSIVDVFTGITCELSVSFGAYDADKIDGQIALRISYGNEKFLPIGSSKVEFTDNDEIVFADDNNILERNFVWKQADKAKISQNTTNLIFFCELFNEMGVTFIDEAKTTIEKRLRTLLNATELETELVHA